MNTKLFISSIFLSTSLSTLSHRKVPTITFTHQTSSEQIIPKEIYGQFGRAFGNLYLWWTLGR